MDPWQAIDDVIALIPFHFAKRNELIAELYEFKNEPTPPTLEEIKECVDFYAGGLVRASWKRDIDNLLIGG